MLLTDEPNLHFNGKPWVDLNMLFLTFIQMFQLSLYVLFAVKDTPSEPSDHKYHPYDDDYDNDDGDFSDNTSHCAESFAVTQCIVFALKIFLPKKVAI